MNFHFKQALEEAKRSQTIEGYAETILRSSIKGLHKFRISDIDVIHFAIIQPESPIPSRIHVFVRYRGVGIFEEIYISDFYIADVEVFSVFETVEKHLRDEGFDCKYVDLNSTTYPNNILRFKIHI